MSSQPNFPAAPGLGGLPQGVDSFRRPRRSVDGIIQGAPVAPSQAPTARPVVFPSCGATSGGYATVAQPSHTTGHFEPVPYAVNAPAGHAGGTREALSPQEHETRAREAWNRSADRTRRDEASDVARLTYTLLGDRKKYAQIVARIRFDTGEALRPRAGEDLPSPDDVAEVLRRRKDKIKKSVTEILDVRPGTDEARCVKIAERAYEETFGVVDAAPPVPVMVDGKLKVPAPPTSDGSTGLYYNTSSRHKRIA